MSAVQQQQQAWCGRVLALRAAARLMLITFCRSKPLMIAWYWTFSEAIGHVTTILLALYGACRLLDDLARYARKRRLKD